MNKHLFLLALLMVTLCCSSPRKTVNTHSVEVKIILEVIELDLLNQAPVYGSNNRRKWVINEIKYDCLFGETEFSMESMLKHFLGTRKDTAIHANNDSLYIEQYINKQFSYSGVDTLWNYETKLEYLLTKYSCNETIKLKNNYFKSKKIKCRNSNFKTWVYSNPFVLNNGEYVIFEKGYHCGSICGYAGRVIYRKIDDQWQQLPGIMLVS